MGLWIDHLGLNTTAARAVPKGDGVPPPSGGIDLLPFPTMLDEGITDLYSDYMKLFRITTSLLSDRDAGESRSSGNSVNNGDAEAEEEDSGRMGVTARLVIQSFPAPEFREELYRRMEASLLMSPAVNFYVFRGRVEELCRWAEVCAAGGSGDRTWAGAGAGAGAGNEGVNGTGGGLELPSSTKTIMSAPFVPTLTFFAAASMGFAIAAASLLIENEMLLPEDESTYLAAPLLIDATFPSKLYRVAKLALNLALERAGYDAFDLNYIHARCLQARYLLLSQHGLSEGARMVGGLGVGKRRKVAKGRKHAGTDAQGERMAPIWGPTLALPPEMVGVVSDAVGNACLMGLQYDPDTFGGVGLSLYDKEMRRRLWWEVVNLDA